MSLDAGQRHSLEGFLFETDKVPACLSIREMKTSQPAQPSRVEGALETRLLSPEVQRWACVLYLLFTEKPVQILHFRNW